MSSTNLRKNPIVISQISVYSNAFPFQMEGKTNDNKYVYVKQRWNKLRIDVNNITVFKCNVDSDFYGYDDVKRLAGDMFIWPN